jgi:hypothetical protein
MMFGKIIAIPVVIVAVAFVGFVPSIEAVPITGTIDIQGGTTLTPVGSPLGTATGVAATTGSVLAGSEAFAGTAGTSLTFSAFTFEPATTPVTLWSFTIGALTYSFDLTSMTVLTYDASFLDISGSGMLSITGTGSTWDATPGSWTYQINSTDPNGVQGIFSYQSSNTAVPDGGMTVILLGSVLSGLCLLRKQISA